MKKRAPTEHEIQAAIVDALRVAGFAVFETTAYLQKGASGVDKGIPDLLVAHDFVPFVYLGIEVKREAAAPFSSAEQLGAYVAKRFVLAWTIDMALEAVIAWVGTWERFAFKGQQRHQLLTRIESVRRACAGEEPA